MSCLSIFIDESGDFGENYQHPAYYLVSLVLHDQKDDIFDQVTKLEQSVASAGFDIEYIHTGPLIRREDVFAKYSIDERRKLLYKIFNFMNSVPIMCDTAIVNRKEAPDKVTLSGKLSRLISNMITNHEEYFHSFDHIIIYYDNGQRELGAILNAVFSAHFNDIEFRKAEPQNYRLLQVADFVCTMELLNIKRCEKRLSNSETHIFYKPQELKKTFLKAVERKNINNILK